MSAVLAVVALVAWIILFVVYERVSYSPLVVSAWFAIVALRPPPSDRS